MNDLPGLPVVSLRPWLLAAMPGLSAEEPWQAQVISGGLSNLTYRIVCGEHRLILRRPPLGPLLPRAHDMHREVRVQRALQDSIVPVAEVLAECRDSEVIGAPFYVMGEVLGQVVRTADDSARLQPSQRYALGVHLVDVLADLHAVDPVAVGLDDYGRWGGYAKRQIRTWGEQWRRARVGDVPAMDQLASALDEAAPQDDRTTIVHGDYRLDNTIVRVEAETSVVAVIDWELSTLGDPLADLGLLLTYWHDEGDDVRAAVALASGTTAMPGFPSSAELTERYAVRSGRDLADLPFHLALAAFKLASIMAGVHRRYLAGKTVGNGFEGAGAAVPLLANRGLHLLSASAN
jgi:aminoglycoside phosphotransferase (APT) family kinase protein